MTLSWQREKIEQLPNDQVILAIIERRKVIKEHRDARGDDRCWLDDYLVWSMLDDSTEKPLEIPEEERMKRCEEFYNNRRSETPDLPKPTERFWISSNIDMLIISPIERLEKLFRIQSAIRKHRDISGRPRTLDDDRELYSVLADKTPADFRLPSRDEFLSREKLGAGCPNFWDSHSSCGKSCNLHKWGPCT